MKSGQIYIKKKNSSILFWIPILFLNSILKSGLLYIYYLFKITTILLKKLNIKVVSNVLLNVTLDIIANLHDDYILTISKMLNLIYR